MITLSSEQVSDFQENGYLITHNLFDAEETNILRAAADADSTFKKHVHDLEDGEGGKAQLVLWNEVGENLWGSIARSERIVNTMEQLLNDEVYHYHSKMSIKQPRTGGAWSWHQDYGYWYQNSVLFPLLSSAMIAVDPATHENGCMQVLKQSHLMGRVDHNLVGEQAGANLERVEEAGKVLEKVYCEMNPGDALFFHCNILHRSDQNNSDHDRWALICCYNAARNNPFRETHHPSYTPLEKVDDDAILKTGLKRFEDDDSKVVWMGERSDQSAKSLGKLEQR